MLLPDLLRSAEPFVGVGRRHADVYHRDVRVVAPDFQHQLVGVSGLAHDLETSFFENSGDAFPKEDGIVGDHYPHGISARMRVPAPGLLSTRSTPSRASTRSTSPRSPEPWVGSAPPRPSSETSTTARPFILVTLTSTA